MRAATRWPVAFGALGFAWPSSVPFGSNPSIGGQGDHTKTERGAAMRQQRQGLKGCLLGGGGVSWGRCVLLVGALLAHGVFGVFLGGCADDLGDGAGTTGRDTAADAREDAPTNTTEPTDTESADSNTSPDVPTQTQDDTATSPPDVPLDTFQDDIADDADATSDTLSADTTTNPPDTSPPPDTTEPPEPLPEVLALEGAALTALQADIRAALSQPSVAGRLLSAQVIDEATGQVLYEENPDLLLRPASNTKLFTTAAAFGLLGPDHRFETVAVASTPPDGAGAIGDLTLIGDHDITWSTRFYDSARWPLDQMAAQLYAAGVRRVNGSLRVHGEFLFDGATLGTYNAAAHRTTTATQWRAALQARGITVVGADSFDAGFDPPVGATTELARWRSLPLAVPCSPLNSSSHNEFADALIRHIGWEIEGASTYAAGETAALNWMQSEGLDTTGIVLHDGSGLSYDNRVSARQVVALIRHMNANAPDTLFDAAISPRWERTLSVSAVRGTLAGRLSGADTVGRVFGKTGTLNVAIATSGALIHKHDGRRYVFAFLMNDQPDQPSARAAQDEAIRAFAVDLHGAAARPASPVLAGVYSTGDGHGVEVSWQTSAGATGYLIGFSTDAHTWLREDARFVSASGAQIQSLTVNRWDETNRVYVRVTALNNAGESDPSDVYGVVVGAGPSRVLVVDANDRWQRQPVAENTLGGGHPYASYYVAALPVLTAGVDTISDETLTTGTINLSNYDAVLWASAEDATTDFSIDTTQQTLIQTYLSGGGALLLTGAEIGWDLATQRDAAQAAFFTTWLQANYVNDDAGTFALTGSPGSIFENLPLMSFDSPDDIVVSYPDTLSPRPGALTALTYVGGSGGAAAIQYSGNYKIVLLGFPFESVNSAPDRAALMDAVISFFDL